MRCTETRHAGPDSECAKSLPIGLAKILQLGAQPASIWKAKHRLAEEEGF
jgi:hypothetical protein